MNNETSKWKLFKAEVNISYLNGKIFIVVLVAALATFLARWVWVGGVLLVVSAHFLLAYLQHRSVARHHASTTYDSAYAEDDEESGGISPDMSVVLDIGGDVGDLRVSAYGNFSEVEGCFNKI